MDGTITDTAGGLLTTGDPLPEPVARVSKFGPNNPTWNEGRVAELKRHLEDGLSYGVIGLRMGTTRSGISGAVYRLGLNGLAPAKPTKRRPSVCLEARTSAGRVRKSRTSEPGIDVRARFDRASPFYGNEPQVRSFPEATDIVAEFTPPNPVRFIDSTGQTCKWPLGEPTAAMLVCGDPVRDQSGCPYCTFHARVAYQPSAPRKPWVPGRAEG